MNKIFAFGRFSSLAAFSGGLMVALALAVPAWAQANAKGEEFFMISSVDQQKHQVVLMRPTQLTVAADLGPQTVCIGDKGEKMTPKDLRAGDTVWAIVKPGKNGAVNALRIREGAMTQAELRQLYLHYSTSGGEPPLPPAPLTPTQKISSAQPPSTAAPGAGTPATAPADATLQRPHKPGHKSHPQIGASS
jgi:hypothetical protein